MTEQEFKAAHNAKLIEILDEFVRVCTEHNLKYYLGYGSVIGAVRHQGIIPWDDDVDVIMPREDYEKLYALGPGVWNKNYRLGCYRNSPGYLYEFMKVEALDTTLIERINPIYVGYVYVDVFPMENVPNEEVDRDITQVVVGYSHRAWDYMWAECPKNYLYKYLKYLCARRQYRKNNELAQWEEYISQYAGTETPYVKHYSGPYFRKGLLKREILGEGTQLLFEGKYYTVPKDYDTYLRVFYGDYMQLPPVEKRNSGHTHFFEDPTRRLTEEELSLILRDLHKRYDYHFSIKHEVLMILDRIKRYFKAV